MSPARLIMSLSVSMMISGIATFAVVVAPIRADSEALAAVFPPWWSTARIFAAAGSAGEIVRTGAVSSIIIVHSEQHLLAERLKDAGALLVLDPVRLALCAPQIAKGDVRD